MKIGRIFRDLLILAIVGIAFFLVVQTASLFGEPDTVVRSEFSEDRQMMDQLVAEKKYEEAIPYLDKLIERDPYSSFALFSKARCLHILYEDAINSGETNERERLFTAAKTTYQTVLDFPAYANRARYNLAVMETREGNDELAMSTLRNAVNTGFYSRKGLWNYDVFNGFRENPEFQTIVRNERRNFENYRRRRRGSLRVQGN